MHVGRKMTVYRLTDASINTCFMGKIIGDQIYSTNTLLVEKLPSLWGFKTFPP